MSLNNEIEKGLKEDFAELPQIKRGLVYCHKCGNTKKIGADNLFTGWPKCCGYTMSLDSPEEHKA